MQVLLLQREPEPVSVRAQEKEPEQGRALLRELRCEARQELQKLHF